MREPCEYLVLLSAAESVTLNPVDFHLCIFHLAMCFVQFVQDACLSTSFPGFSPTRPTERLRERPWKTLVTCLPESGRLQTSDLEEGQVSVRFVSTECRQVNAAMKLCSFSGNSLVYLIVLFRQKFPLVSVIVVVGLANLSCCCDHCVSQTKTM